MSTSENLLILPFPELFRDEIFRIETPRLWLRWPAAGDAARLEEIVTLEAAARGTGAAPHPLLAGKVGDRIATARATNESGRGLVLALAPKAGSGPPVGLITADLARGGALALCFIMDVRHQGRGLMTEAVRALAHAAFVYGPYRVIRGPASLSNHAGRRVLEKCWFKPTGEAAEQLGRLELTRADWLGRAPVRIDPTGIVQGEEMCSACAA